MTEHEQDLSSKGSFLERCKVRANELSILLSEVEIKYPDETETNQN